MGKGMSHEYLRYARLFINLKNKFNSLQVQQTQREQMAVVSFLASLPSKFDMAKSQILSSPGISSLQETFSRLLCTGISPSI